jgi:hypothetical protein
VTDQRGQVSLFALGLAIVVLAVAGLAVDGTRALLLRRSLQNVADAAALEAADALDVERIYRRSDIRLDEARAVAAAGDALARRGLDALSSIAVREGEITIVLRGALDTTFLGLVGIDAVPVAVESVARPVTVP